MTHALAFVTDADVRDDLRLDIAAVDRALANREWKAATVLAGSAIEALLLSKLRTVPEQELAAVARGVLKRDRPLEEWHLREYIDVATVCPRPLPTLRSDTGKQAQLAKDFRNLIHSGRVLRRAQKCNRGTALAAVVALEIVVEDLTR
jgi:hypothetical protein